MSTDKVSIVACRPLQQIKKSNQNTLISKNGYQHRKKATVKTFPGAKSRQLNHSVTTTMQECSYDPAIIHVGINNSLRYKHHDELYKLPRNIIKVAKTCQMYHIGKIFISEMLQWSRTRIIIFDNNKVARFMYEIQFWIYQSLSDS